MVLENVCFFSRSPSMPDSAQPEVNPVQVMKPLSTSIPARCIAFAASWRCSLRCERGWWLEVRSASCAWFRLRLCYRLCQFPLVESRDRWLRRSCHGRCYVSGRKGIVFRFLIRYLLMAVGAYVILTVSPASLNGLLAGLFLPVAAIGCEAIYELYVALARGV